MKLSLRVVIIVCTVFFVMSTPPVSAATTPLDDMTNWGTGMLAVQEPVSGLSNEKIYDIVVALMKWLLILIGLLAVIAFVISGILYLTSAGSEDQVARAKRMMVYGLIGTVIALAGVVIIRAVDRMLKGQSF